MRKNSILIAILAIILLEIIAPTIAEATSVNGGSYSYMLTVDDEGKIKVEIKYSSELNKGFSWVLVPKNFTEWKLSVISGEIESSKITDAYTKLGEKFVFYNNFTFKYKSNGLFEMKITYEMDYGSIIVEPKCFFFSPQIGYCPKDSCIVHIFLPKTAQLDQNKMSPKADGIREGDNFYEAVFYLKDNMARIAIEYTTSREASEVVIERGIFSVRTPTRYKHLAERLLNAYEKVYANLTRIFHVNLTEVKVQFYAPTLEDLWIGGFIPFNGTHLGIINLNLFYVRTALGYWEQIAIHELVHHFVWAAGIMPDLLWFHEGLAEYVSFELTLKAGWKGAEGRRVKLEKLAKALYPDYGFIQEWKPGELEGDVMKYYAASYMVVKALADKYGGLNFYSEFFRKIRGLKNVTSTDMLIYYLSAVAGEDLTLNFTNWKFNVINIYEVHEKIRRVKEILSRQIKFAQPWIAIAEKLVREAEQNVRNGDFRGALIKASIAEFIASFALSLTILSAVILLALIVLRMSGGGIEQER